MSKLFRRSFSQHDSSSRHRSISDIGKEQNSDKYSSHGLDSISNSGRRFINRVQVPFKDFEPSLAPSSDLYHLQDHGVASGELRPQGLKSNIGTSRTDSNQQKSIALSHRKSKSNVERDMDSDRSRTRRERTFVGSECAVCEEPLEHTLRGERVLQFSCGHVSHEACFYEHIKEFESQYCPSCNAPLGLDTSRGGNVLDIEKLSSIVRSVSANEPQRTSQSWENQPERSSRGSFSQPNNRDLQYKDGFDNRDRTGRYSAVSRRSQIYHNSGQTHTPSEAYSETVVSLSHGKNGHERQISEMGITSPVPSLIRNPIPPPSVTVRSEFPTINRSREQQMLTCLISVTVSDNNWRPDPEDLRRISSPAIAEETYTRPPSPARSVLPLEPNDSPEKLSEITENLRQRVENWHGLDFSRFGRLKLHGKIRVGKDSISWQELECFLFAEMLVCVKEKKVTQPSQWDDPSSGQKKTRCTLKGSILIKKHLNEVIETSYGDENVLTLSLSVAELPSFHLRFENLAQMKIWQRALLGLNAPDEIPTRSAEHELMNHDEEDWQKVTDGIISKHDLSLEIHGNRPSNSVPTNYANTTKNTGPFVADHVPVDIVVVVPVSSSMQGVKISLVRDALKFIVQNLGDSDRLGIVTFGSSSGATALVGMTTIAWNGWFDALSSIKPVGHKNHRSDVVEGANVAMDLLMQRKTLNPIATIFLISDSSTSDQETADFVVSRAEAAKVAIHSFGLGMTHKPDIMVDLSTRTKASYMYVKDWMMLRECLAGCLGAMYSISHQNVKLKLRIPEGSPAKFVKINGVLQITKRATGKDAEASLGDLRFGDKKDVLVQLIIASDQTTQEQVPQDPWESIVSGLEALGDSDKDEERVTSIEEVPLIQADLSWGDILRDGTVCHLPRPSLLAITMLPISTMQEKKNSSGPVGSPLIPPHPNIVQRRMELLTSDMLNRALTLVSRGQHDRAQRLLNETRSILKGLGKGSLPPIPPTPSNKSPRAIDSLSNTTTENNDTSSPTSAHTSIQITSGSALNGLPSDTYSVGSSAGIDPTIVSSLDAELEASLEWISHPAVFSRDSRKSTLQAIGVISSQRGYTFRSPIESSWASRIRGVRLLTERSKEWREESGGESGIMEEL
ncbi:putative vwa-like protein [Golovinomyces cichoracearum]|uniref:Putative vwa-like protein n=1 Tax=Golovinomyces cichoracearum TaxID=62708 RepID=A0A420J783_9PEZI|nr:putative vwa-like protein [Golovinomyces cichoracearum]